MTLSGNDWQTELWLAVILSGLYHGVSPGMGWPLAVSAGLMDKQPAAVFRALGPLAAGHFAAMAVIILPFALLTMALTWQREIQLAAALLVIGFGTYLLINRRHPRFLARIPPHRLALWSFLIAIAHGAGLMLVPIYLGICSAVADAGHAAAGTLMNNTLAMAVLVSAIHTAAMIAAGGVLAWAVYRYLGLTFISKSWFNLDVVWAASLIGVGVISLAAVS